MLKLSYNSYIKKNKTEWKKFLSKIADKSKEDQKEAKSKYKSSIKPPSLIWCLIKISYEKFFSGAVLKLVYDSLQFVGPLILE